MVNFNSSKPNLSLRYRLGLERALAKADFLNVADIVLVQALVIFLALTRRHDNPKYVWMMTGLVIRMAQFLGLQRDGTHFEQLTPFEIEMRRRVWGSLIVLDMRASEDQGTDLTITSGNFDTKMPLNINDADIDPETKHKPVERDGLTYMSVACICIGLWDIMRQLMAPSVRDGTADLEEKSRMVNEIYERWEQGYLRHITETGNILYWVSVHVARITMAKMTLIAFLPVLFSSPSENFSDEIRIKLLVSAIEVAEYNHALNAEQAARQWRWVYQTYTHWHAIVYLVIEISRRPWSATVVRAWVALHSSWLIPAQTSMDEKTRMWVPLRKLIAQARRHRDAELSRLRTNRQAAARLGLEDQRMPAPSSSGQFTAGFSVEQFRERWRRLIAMPAESEAGPSQQPMTSISTDRTSDSSAHMSFGPTYPETSEQQIDPALEGEELDLTNVTSIPAQLDLGETMAGPVPDVFSDLGIDLADMDMDLEGDVNWYDWIESAHRMEGEGIPGE